jgi:hypothetical protein
MDHTGNWKSAACPSRNLEGAPYSNRACKALATGKARLIRLATWKARRTPTAPTRRWQLEKRGLSVSQPGRRAVLQPRLQGAGNWKSL